jgi:putative ABC transport system permease protein
MGRALQLWMGLLGGEILRSLLRHKLRSALTTLGITIGVAAVVCVVAVGEAGAERAEAQLASLGDNLVWVEAGSRNVAGVRTGAHGTTSLTIDDAEAIRREVSLITRLSPQVDATVQVVFDNRNWSTRGRGVAPDYLPIRGWTIARGAVFSDEDVATTANVCLIGQTVRRQLFGDLDPVGRDVRVGVHVFQIVGVLAPKGQSGDGRDQDDTVFMPYTTVQRKLKGRGYDWVDDIMCSAVSRQAVNPAIDRVTALMRQRHHILPGVEDDFNIRRPDEVIKAQIEASRTLELLLVSIASVSLVVGGIGIMNVMLASVAQRTREIGVRMAVGATEGAVLLQFLGEAVALSLFGGVLGVLASAGGSFAIGRALDWPMRLPPEALALALGFSIAVGVFFGLYPARKAARLDPIEALRHE